MYSKTTATWLRNDYTRVLDNVEYNINKNFQQMDLENVQIRTTMESHVNTMINKCSTTNDNIKNQQFE